MSRIRIEYVRENHIAVQMYVDGERVERLGEINADESRANLREWKVDGRRHYVEFDAEIEWGSENGNKTAFLRNIRREYAEG